jgi:predicted O-methyltransferase YrrM
MLMVLDDRELVTIEVKEDRHEAARLLSLRLHLEADVVVDEP